MVDRTVTYRLSAEIGQFRAKMAQASASVKDAGDRMTSATKEGAKFRAGLDQAADAAGKIGLVAGAGLAAAVVTAANFDQSMSHVAAATGETTANMERLREAAIEAGAQTAFSASEAAAGIEDLAKAGVQTADILDGGLQGALDLAAAGTIEVADAAETAATAMTQFGLSGDQVPHIADLLAAAAGKAQGEVSDMAYALRQSGQVANQTGLSIEETTGALAAFASAGLLGSDAGTSFKTMLQRLAAPVGAAKKEMQRLGLSAFDAQGNFIGLAEFAGQLEQKLAGMSQQQKAATLSTMFGSDAVRAATVLYDQGADGINKWIDAVDDQGFAAETAAKKLDNLKGDLEALSGSLETALIGTGDGAQGPLRSLTQNATDAVNAYNDLPGSIKNVTAGLLGLTAVIGGAAWFGSKTIRAVSDTREALDNLGTSGKRVGRVMGTLTKAVGAFAAVTVAREVGNGFLNFDQAEGDIRRYLELVQAGANSNDLSDQIEAVNLAIAEQKKIVDDAAFSFSIGIGSISSNDQADDARDRIDALKEALADLEVQQKAARLESERSDSSTKRYIESQVGVTRSLEEQVKAQENALDAMKSTREEAVRAADAEINYYAAIDEANAAIEENGRTLDLSTEAGRANKSALIGLAEAWNGQSDAAKNAKGAYREAKDTLFQTARQMGATEEEARRYVRTLLEIPPRIPTQVVLTDYEKAERMMDRLTREREIKLGIRGPGGYVPSSNFASGGPVRGPGTATSDSIPAYLSNGEYVMNAAAVSRYGQGFFDRLNARKFAAGGPVTPVGAAGSGLSEGDLSRLAQAIMRARPLYGDVTVIGDKSFEREQRRRSRLAAAGGVSI